MKCKRCYLHTYQTFRCLCLGGRSDDDQHPEGSFRRRERSFFSSAGGLLSALPSGLLGRRGLSTLVRPLLQPQLSVAEEETSEYV